MTGVMKRVFQLLLCLFLAVSGPQQLALAAEPDDEPEITITRSQTEIIEEYRANGRLYMIKITPKKGFAYYLVDTDGDGSLDSRHNELDEGILIPRWTLFSW
ncbi:MAG TPA: DUF2782 domain-containing protein [Chromatiales bacterium]|nr:DUF2782 domain-containing protein [Chromatiales bacterium]